jgi:phosphatidylglycerol:prolipoprotein diacylglycerol transferase
VIVSVRDPALPSFPRYFRIAGHWVNAYKVFLCVGISLGTLLSAAVAERSGLSPLRVGLGGLVCVVLALIGARAYHLLVNFRVHQKMGFWTSAWDPRTGGWSVFGGLIVVPFLAMQDSVLGIPVPVFWDHFAVGIAFGGAWIRFGCVWNGCCAGRESRGWFALRQHDVHGVYKRRVPAQWLEIAWWLLACVGLLWLWPEPLPPGCHALAVLAWYGLGRFWQEPLRESPELVFGRVRVNQVVGALLAIAAGAGLFLRML